MNKIKKDIPGIKPYAIPELIPDILYIYNLDDGREALINAIEISDENDPKSIIFNIKYQDNNKALLENRNKVFYSEPEVVENKIISCPKCKQNKTKYYTAQIRSADEPMTAFASCIICGHNWSFSMA